MKVDFDQSGSDESGFLMKVDFDESGFLMMNLYFTVFSHANDSGEHRPSSLFRVQLLERLQLPLNQQAMDATSRWTH